MPVRLCWFALRSHFYFYSKEFTPTSNSIRAYIVYGTKWAKRLCIKTSMERNTISFSIIRSTTRNNTGLLTYSTSNYCSICMVHLLSFELCFPEILLPMPLSHILLLEKGIAIGVFTAAVFIKTNWMTANVEIE